MKKNWLPLVGFLALSAGHAVSHAQDDETAPVGNATPTVETPAPVIESIPETTVVQPAVETVDSTAIGLRRALPNGGFTNAQRSTVRIVRNGRIVQTRRVGEGGVAQISEVTPGAYTVIASGGEGFTVFGAHLGDSASTMTDRVGLVPSRDSAEVRRLIQAHIGSDVAGEPAPTKNEVVSGVRHYHPDFEIAANGTVSGQVVHTPEANEEPRPIANAFIAFVRDGQAVTQSRTDANGDFTVSGLDAGIYSFVTSSTRGFAAFSTAVVQPESHVQAGIKRISFVSFLATSTSTAAPAAAGDLPLFLQILSTSPRDNAPPTAMGTGGPGAGGFGGGGGAGAGGGFGGGGLLGALAAGGAIGALIADQANNDNPKASP